MKKFISISPEQTRAIASRLSALLVRGDIICLRGHLGSGKTVFAKGIASGLGIEMKKVISPTFVIIREHGGGSLPLYHFDLYRLDEPGQADALGIEEYFQGDGVCVVEWPDKLGHLQPQEYLLVNIIPGRGASNVRRLELIPRGERYLRLLKGLK